MTALEPAVALSPGYNPATSHSLDTTRVNNFDLVRLFGALQVALVHATEHLHAVALAPIAGFLGYFPGVPIFFAVSGFLVSLSLERALSLKQYALNRALRIFPALWACFAVSVFLIVASGVRLPSLGEFAVWAGTQLTVVQFYNPAWLRDFGVGALNGSLWTIPVELQFYGLLPVLALWAGKQPKRWALLCAFAVALMMALRSFGPSHESLTGKLLEVSLAPYLFFFLMGVVLRYAYTAYPIVFRGQALWWGVAYAIWIAVENALGIPGATGNLLNVVSIVLLSALAIAVAFTCNTVSTRTLGNNDISYGVYIYHMPVVNVALENGLIGPQGLVIALSVTVVLASLSWRFIERPALSLKHYTLKPRR